MLLIQNKRVDWDTHTIGIPGHTTKDKENRRIPFDPDGRASPEDGSSSARVVEGTGVVVRQLPGARVILIEASSVEPVDVPCRR